ncbi:MAG: cytochrome c3 family protein [Planctomycetes bacterium]|nr:cytochrome c3 family protein [Planctomycetota bacterium]
MVLLKRALPSFLLFLALALSGCLVAQKLGLIKTRVRFSHKTHLKQEELQCTSCHRKAESEDKAGMPSMKQCLLCHEGVDEELAPEKRPVAVFGEKPTWSSVTHLPEENIFSHKAHFEAKVACSECHKGIEKSEIITKKVRVEMAACTRCHGRQEASTACETCHKEIRQDWSPESHKHEWKRYHGGVARSESPRSEDQCSLCHQEAACNACHQDEAPQNHNSHWRTRGHWISASMDRRNCAACHRSDYCDRCHEETAPRNHLASWGSTRNQHCLSCHFPLRNESCFTCHKSDPGHQLAPSRPADAQHAVAQESNCRTCHNVIGLTHPDSGDNCGACH